MTVTVLAPGDAKPLESYLDMAHNTGLRSVQLGVPTYRDAGFISAWLAAVLAQVASPVLEEVRFAVYPILRADAKRADDIVRAFAWKDIVGVLGRPPFTTLRRVVFVAGRSMDYMQIPGAFVPLQPVLERVLPEAFEPLVEKGVEIAVSCA